MAPNLNSIQAFEALNTGSKLWNKYLFKKRPKTLFFNKFLAQNVAQLIIKDLQIVLNRVVVVDVDVVVELLVVNVVGSLSIFFLTLRYPPEK